MSLLRIYDRRAASIVYVPIVTSTHMARGAGCTKTCVNSERCAPCRCSVCNFSELKNGHQGHGESPQTPLPTAPSLAATAGPPGGT